MEKVEHRADIDHLPEHPGKERHFGHTQLSESQSEKNMAS